MIRDEKQKITERAGRLMGSARIASDTAQQRFDATSRSIEERLSSDIAAVAASCRQESKDQSARLSADLHHSQDVRRSITRAITDPRSRPGVAPSLLSQIGTEHGSDIPLAIPFIDTPGLHVRPDGHGGRDAAHDLTVAIVHQLLQQIPLPHLRIHVYDPRLSSILAPLGPLREARSESFPSPVTSTEGLTSLLEELIDHTQRTTELMARTGHQRLSEYWGDLDTPEGEYRVLVLLDYPQGIDDRIARLHAALSGAPGRGVCLVIVSNPEAPHDGRDTDPRDLVEGLSTVIVGTERVMIAEVDDRTSLGNPHRVALGDIHRVVEDAVAQKAAGGGPTVDLGSVLPALEHLGTKSSAQGLEATIGRAQREPLRIRLTSANPPMPNMLVGGAVGQGKSNLLLSIICSLAAEYSPEELEFLLLDFKEGVEFRRFGPDTEGENWLPHASLIALESNPSFGISVLQHLADEIRDRAIRFKRAGVSDYDSYRASGSPLPRIVLIADEFQMLFSGSDDAARTAVRILEQIARQGRSSGIHLILASQTLSGIRALATKEQAIFGQFASRLSLKNKAQESETILSRGNKAAADLTYRGEVILNENFGEDPELNRKGISALAEASYVRGLQTRLWEQFGDSDRRPMIFDPHAAVSWDRRMPSTETHVDDDEGWTIDLGREIAVTDVPVLHRVEVGRAAGLAVVGPDSEAVEGLTAASIAALLEAHPDRRCVIVLGARRKPPPWLDLVLEAVATDRAKIDVLTGQAALEFIRDELPDASDLNFIAVQPGRISGLADPLPTTDRFAPKISGVTGLMDAVASGHSRRIDTVTTWSTYGEITPVLGRDHAGITGFALVDQARRTLHEVTGKFDFQPPEESPRFVYVRRGSAEPAVIGIPLGLPDIHGTAEPAAVAGESEETA